MEIFLKICAISIIATILSLTLSNQRKDVALLLSIAVCCMLGVVIINYFRPVFDFFKSMKNLGDLDGNLLSTMLKCVGIGFLGEITTTICNDAGNNAMGKILHLLTTVLILSLSVPLFERLLSIIQEILTTI